MDYQLLTEQLTALTDGVNNPVTNLANAAALLYHTLPEINWAGFYLLNGETLELAPFQGKPACVKIPLGKGVCGTAASERRVLRVDDVHAFAGHIACDSASRSEIVLPLYRDGSVFGVLDIDSPVPSRFTAEDEAGLTAFAVCLEEVLTE